MSNVLLRIIIGALALIVALSLISYNPLDTVYILYQGSAGAPKNLCGSFGSFIAGILQTLFGIGAWTIPFYMLWECSVFDRFKLQQRISWLMLSLSIWITLGGIPKSRIWNISDGQQYVELRWGGSVGHILWPTMKQALGIVGLPIVLLLTSILAILLLAPSFMRIVSKLTLKWFDEKVLPSIKKLHNRSLLGILNFFISIISNIYNKKSKNDDIQESITKSISRNTSNQKSINDDQIAALTRAEREYAEYRKITNQSKFASNTNEISQTNLTNMTDYITDININSVNNKYTSLIVDDEFSNVLSRTHSKKIEPNIELTEKDMFNHIDKYTDSNISTEITNKFNKKDEVSQNTNGLNININKNSINFQDGINKQSDLLLPPHSIFDPPKLGHCLDSAMLEATRLLLQEKFNEFKVKGSVVGLRPGPVVTVYEFQPDSGVPVAKVLNLEEDLALRLEVEKVRIDRIAGCNLVGIEVPNQHREIISFREIIDSHAFQNISKNNINNLLKLALGKDMAGNPMVVDLANMPHLLIGGSTGSGKSVGVNAMICSLLLRAMPNEVKLILIDPKMVELGIYEDIPHLWAPVVTDMKEAGRVLKWVVTQMEDRYKRLAMINVRNLDSFNKKITEAGGQIDISSRTPNPRWLDRPSVLETLPYVVVVIDELADLMMVCRAEVEDSIARIAQKARAVGIHLILATQRPSVDIVTGVIKANLPSRISYRVNTKIDSRTILDSSGGEQLLGKGDALYLAPGSARPQRIHAPLITEEETYRLVDWLKNSGKPNYNAGLLNAIEVDEIEQENTEVYTNSGDDNIYEKALVVIKRERKASTSLLQRKLNIGYGRAARIIDRMEDEGIIGSDRGAGRPREVFISNS